MKKHIFVCCALAGVATAVLASDRVAADEGTAKQAYTDGVELFDRGEYAQAADKFREAYRLKPTWKVLYNVGQSEAAASRAQRSRSRPRA